MSDACKFCAHYFTSFECIPCMHMEPRPYGDNTIILKDLFELSPSISGMLVGNTNVKDKEETE